MGATTRTNRIETRKRPLLILAIIVISLFGIPCESVLSHPHVFVVQRIECVFDNKGLAGFRVVWKFDDMFSSMIVGDYDKNQNNSLEPDEVITIKENAFSHISNYNYFTFVKIDETPFEVKFVKDFKAELVDHKLTYEFFVPCHVAATNIFKHVIVATYDPSYYTAVFFAEERPAALRAAEAFDVKSAIKMDESTSIYYDMVHPWALFLDFREKQ